MTGGLGQRGAPVVLEYDATVPPPDGQGEPLSRLIGRPRLSLGSLVEALERAGRDRGVAALLVKVGGTGWEVARAQEFRDAVLAFRRNSGRPAVAWSETFGEFAHGSIGYYLATAFDEIWLQPSGDVGLTGVAVEATFLAEALDKLGVRPEIMQRHEYKNAADALLRTGFTPAHREAAERLAASAAEQIVSGVAEQRRLPVDRVRELVDAAPLAAETAVRERLVDRLGYRDQVYDDVLRRTGDGTRLLYLARYARSVSPMSRIRQRRHPVIAVVEGTGAIHSGRSRRGPLRGPSIGSDTISAALRAAVKSEPAAVVLRINSPGGSYVASDVIWREVACVRAAGLPVVASMGDVAASGGYFVAMGADAILAQPGTLTGSIGVFGGKPVTADLLERLGIGHDAVTEGRHARMFSTRRGFTAEERDLLDRWLDRVYADFTAKVAQGRGMSLDDVHEVARGRVWTGADAKRRGLVDEFGGLRRAVAVAAERAGADPSRARIRRFPQSHPLSRLRPPRSSEDPAAAGVAEWGPLSGIAACLGLPAEGPLMLPYALRLR
ncbi:MAG: signal peptide peptidase SppA [Geodermatophilaceae bacterium]|nr:signal peptide peptidase SppA [Geodermatophilaceae bacterium]